MSNKILCVDDDANILAGYQRTLRKQFAIDIAVGPEAGLKAIEGQGPYAVVVADMQMPGMNGIQFLTKTREHAPDTVRVMLTGNADQKTAIDAVNQGHVFRFLTKPCSPEELASVLKTGLAQYRLVMAERELLGKTLNGSIKMLTDILSILDPQSFGVGQKMREYIRLFAQSLKLNQTWDLELAAMLSRIGFVTIPATVLQKSRSEHGLSGEEKDMLARVPEIGANLLNNIPRLESVASIVLYQNKNFDGSGFPTDKTAGEEIPVGSRILKVLADLLLIESKGIPRFKALTKMRECPGRYDPKVLEAIAAAFDVFLVKPDDEASTKPICFKELRVGHVLKTNVMTADGTLIVTAGTEVSQVVMEKLHNFADLSGIKEPIYVEG